MKLISTVLIALSMTGCTKSDERTYVYVDSKEARDHGMEVIAKHQRDLLESDKMLDAELEAAKKKSSAPQK